MCESNKPLPRVMQQFFYDVGEFVATYLEHDCTFFTPVHQLQPAVLFVLACYLVVGACPFGVMSHTSLVSILQTCTREKDMDKATKEQVDERGMFFGPRIHLQQGRLRDMLYLWLPSNCYLTDRAHAEHENEVGSTLVSRAYAHHLVQHDDRLHLAELYRRASSAAYHVGIRKYQ